VANEGDALTLDASGSSDPDGVIVSYEWDLDGDGEYDDATGITAMLDAVDGPAMVTVGLRVTDDYGETDIDTATVEIDNVAPGVKVDENTVTVDEGQTAQNEGTYSDAGDDTVALGASVGAITDHNDGTWSWSFVTSDGPDESQTVTIWATDEDGEAGQVTFDLVVNNVDPTVDAGLDATIILGEVFQGSGSFADPGADTWSAEVDYGEDGGDQPLGLIGKDFVLSHTYSISGSHTVCVTVTDDDTGVGTDVLVVTVRTTQEATDDIIEQVQALVDEGWLSEGQGNSLIVKLEHVKAKLGHKNPKVPFNGLDAFINHVQGFVDDRVLIPEVGQSLIDAARRIQQVL
jgi:hypothetical protein